MVVVRPRPSTGVKATQAEEGDDAAMSVDCHTCISRRFRLTLKFRDAVSFVFLGGRDAVSCHGKR